MTYTIAAFYQFVDIVDTAALRQMLRGFATPLELCGTLLIAPEGINGTLAGSEDNIQLLTKKLNELTGLDATTIKYSTAPEKPFNRLKIRLKKEIITFKQPEANPTRRVGAYVKPQDWNRLISDPGVVVLDTRNVYETMIGTFKGAVDPKIEQFTDFASFVRTRLNPAVHKKIAMYCTGGIRCEKASAFMLAEGFAEVYHLQGGILKYLEEVPATESQWQGECYVFDKRMAVGHGLTTGNYSMCFCCGYPLDAAAKTHPHFEDGVSCAHCFGKTTAADKARYRARQQQITSQERDCYQNA